MTTARLAWRAFASEVWADRGLRCHGQVSGVAAGTGLGGELPAGAMERIVGRLADRMEKGDTISEKIVEYGLCGISLAYLAAQMIRAVLN
ncbi:MAG: hypothetical protein ACOY31_04460 [Bacillota bacterium]